MEVCLFMIFLNDIHKNNFKNLLNNTEINFCDKERIALFYIIAGNNDLFSRKSIIYNFVDNNIKFYTFDCLNEDFCYSSKALIRLGANLYNGYTDNYIDPLNLLGYLDSKNYKLAINSIKLRFENIREVSIK